MAGEDLDGEFSVWKYEMRAPPILQSGPSDILYGGLTIGVRVHNVALDVGVGNVTISTI